MLPSYPCTRASCGRKQCLRPGSSTSANSESPEFIGRAVAALAGDQDVCRWTGQVLVAAALAEHYGFADIDGRSPRPLTLTDV